MLRKVHENCINISKIYNGKYKLVKKEKEYRIIIKEEISSDLINDP